MWCWDVAKYGPLSWDDSRNGGAAATLIVAPADVNRRVRRVCTRNSLYIQVVRSFVSIEPKMVRTRSVHYPVKYHSYLKLLVDPSRSHCYFISMQNRRASFLLYHKSTGVLRRRHLEVERWGLGCNTTIRLTEIMARVSLKDNHAYRIELDLDAIAFRLHNLYVLSLLRTS